MILGDLDTGERLLTMHDIGERLGIKAESWRSYVAWDRAPQADGYVGRTPVWRESTVDRWAQARNDRREGPR